MIASYLQTDGAEVGGPSAIPSASPSQAPIARPMTTKELLSYARGMAAWVHAASAPPPAPPELSAPAPGHSRPPVSQTQRPSGTEPDTDKGARPHSSKRSRRDGPYDICPPDMAPSTSYAASAASTPAAAGNRAPRPVAGLPPGVVVLKGFLSLDEQIRIVRQIRDLGIGPGGFYVPSYGTGARLSLHMMCLGLHWEPRTSKYEQTRSSYDGATPPPIPPWLVELCGRGLAAASTASAAAASPSPSPGPGGGSARLPPLQPDICLANFYERSGRLGMHQDKDEMPDSLRAGLPVVSLSIGDAADFQYGRTRDVDEASSVRLESGDLLVFGGPGRMIFHSVTKIHPNTAPPELIRATGLRPGRLNLTFRQYRAAAAANTAVETQQQTRAQPSRR